MSRSAVLVLVLLLGAGTVACADNLVFATRTSMGMKITPVQNNQSEISLGYDREELAIFPVPQSPEEGGPPDGAFRVFARFFMTNAWRLVDGLGDLPSGIQIHSLIATGDAADCSIAVATGSPEDCEDDS